MIAFIDDHREVYGVEPICKVLPIAPSTYHAHIAQRIDPSKRSARAQRDAELKIEVQGSSRRASASTAKFVFTTCGDLEHAAMQRVVRPQEGS